MYKKIEKVEICFENFESIIFPYKCIKSLEYSLKDDGNIEMVKFIIEDNGNSKYAGISVDNNIKPMISPIERIANFNDIDTINVIYEDKSIRRFVVPWEDGRYDSDKLQRTKLLSYNEIYIEII